MRSLRAAPLRATLRRRLGRRDAALRVLQEEAARHGARALLVGGPVRDLLGDHEIGDLDVVLTDSLPAVARATASRLGAAAELRPRFLTATLTLAGAHLDLSQARREHYPHPGALPVVEPGSLDDDLARRDFSVNALALPLAPQPGERLLDPTGGAADLARGRLRSLHSRSFLDDATRGFRAARYAARLGLRLEPATQRQLRDALAQGALARISGDRVRHELERLLAEPAPARALEATVRFGVLSACVPGWSPRAAALRGLARLARGRALPPWPEAEAAEGWYAAGWRLLLLGSHTVLRARVLERLGLRGRPGAEIDSDVARLAADRRALQQTRGDGSLDARLGSLGEAQLLALWCSSRAPVARRVARYARALRHVRSTLDGHAARSLGLRGPDVGAFLRVARRRQLDGRSTDDAWARAWMARRRAMR